MSQLCWEMGFPSEGLAQSFADDESPILDFYPEFGHFRDIVFSFKFLMNPNMKSFPSHTEAWDHSDARLRWSWRPGKTVENPEQSSIHSPKSDPNNRHRYLEDGRRQEADPNELGGEYRIKAFRGLTLRCEGFEYPDGDDDDEAGEGEASGGKPEDGKGSKKKGEKSQKKQRTEKKRKRPKEPGFFAKLWASWFRKQTRAPPSGADPSLLARAQIESEDDVLHLKQLPDFGGSLSQSDSEYLLCALTGTIRPSIHPSFLLRPCVCVFVCCR